MPSPKARLVLLAAGIAAALLALPIAFWISRTPVPPSLEGRAAAPKPAVSAAPLLIAPAPTPSPAPPDLCASLYPSICGRRGTTRDPTGFVKRDVVGELKVLRIYEDLIREHPEWTSDQVDEALVTGVYTARNKDKLEGAYRWVANALERFIESQPPKVFSAKEKKLLRERIRSTELQIPPPATVYADEPDLFTKNDVYYERLLDGRMRLRVGGAYLFTVTSRFNMIFTLAHEFAHAIDPCEMRAIGLALPAYDRLGACFLQNGLILARKTRSECGEDDQLSETFADWVAVQITGAALSRFATEFDRSQLMGAIANSVRDLCEQEESLYAPDLSLHPSPQVRIEKIFGQHPEVRRILGCGSLPSPETYCDFNWSLKRKER